MLISIVWSTSNLLSADRAACSSIWPDAVEFLRRFLLHVLPVGLVRIRQFGFLSNRVRAHQLQLCRPLLAARFPPPCDPTALASPDSQACPNCKRGRLIVIEIFRAGPRSFPDTS
jgi:Putative transposase